ncbi:hypothetical protein F4818DRAFT_429685 [Hypoxylon cercidicola]|nr:hypothetical protein F4818DRAFT_429685 [Hypoxylon cercidicola]
MVTTRSASKAASPAAPSPSRSPIAASASTTTATTALSWAHAPSRATLWWLLISLPLVVWDSVYVLFRPWTMEGGPLHWPLYVPYRKYGEVDHVYGWQAFEARNGFTSAQGSLNVVETAMYCLYLYLYYTAGVRVARSSSTKVLTGRPAAVAVLTVFSASVMTLSKTVLYWLQEFFSDFEHVGHNNLYDLIVIWIIPNGFWLIFPTYIIYTLWGEIVDGLTIASTGVPIKSE